MARKLTPPVEDRPAATGRPWHHLPGGRFRNPPGSPNRTAGLADMLPFMGRMFRHSLREVTVPDHHVLPRPEATTALENARDRDPRPN